MKSLQYIRLQILKSPELDRVSQVESHQCWVGSKLLTQWQNSSCILRGCWPSLWQGHFVRSCSIWRSAGFPGSFSAELISSWALPSMYLYMELFHPMCRILHFPLMNFTRFLSAYLSSLLRSLWIAAHSNCTQSLWYTYGVFHLMLLNHYLWKIFRKSHYLNFEHYQNF